MNMVEGGGAPSANVIYSNFIRHYLEWKVENRGDLVTLFNLEDKFKAMRSS